jgi:hypothetical protein
MKKLLSGILAVALAAPLTVSTAMAQYEQEWKRMDPVFRPANPESEARLRRGGDELYLDRRPGMVNPRTGYRESQGTRLPEAEIDVMSTGSIGVARGLSAQHIAWCQDRFVTYRASDNTYQAGTGPREQCISPY